MQETPPLLRGVRQDRDPSIAAAIRSPVWRQHSRITRKALLVESRFTQMFVQQERDRCFKHRHLNVDRLIVTPFSGDDGGENAVHSIECTDLVRENSRNEPRLSIQTFGQSSETAGSLDD